MIPFLVACIALVARSPINDEPPRQYSSPAALAKALSSIRLGMTRREVRDSLGVPGDEDSLIFQWDDYAEGKPRPKLNKWVYWPKSKSGSDRQVGEIWFNDEGRVDFVWSTMSFCSRDTEFRPGERQRLLALIRKAPDYQWYGYNPPDVLNIVNRLIPLGKDRALRLLADASPQDSLNGGVFLILKCMFEIPNPPGHMPRMWVGAASNEPADLRLCPRYPILLAHAIPFLVVGGYNLGGHPQDPIDHVVYFSRCGRLHSARATR